MAESFVNTFGCMFIALVLDLICFGAGMLVVLQYFRSSLGSSDSRGVRSMVGALGLLSCVHIATFVHVIYVELIVRFGRFEELDFMPRTGLVQLLAIYIISFISQCFFVSRIWYLTRNLYLAAPIALLALLNICAGIAQTTLAGIGGTFGQLIHTEVVTSIQAGATAACDLTITVALCWILNGKRTGIRATDTLLDTLIILAINRGAITSLAALFNLVLFVWRPSAMFFMIPLLPSCQFYVLSVVGSLNTRARIRNQTSQDVLSLPMDSMNNPEHEHNEERAVHVTTSVMTWADEENTDRKRGDV